MNGSLTERKGKIDGLFLGLGVYARARARVCVFACVFLYVPVHFVMHVGQSSGRNTTRHHSFNLKYLSIHILFTINHSPAV